MAREEELVPGKERGNPVGFLLRWLKEGPCSGEVTAIGHRIVYGMDHAGPVFVTPRLLRELRERTPFDPDHLPRERELLVAAELAFPRIPQVACFDTSFHQAMPRSAKLLALPHRLEKHGARRYGFHGLSYAFLMGELERVGGAREAEGRVILAHLGSGASMAAMYKGKALDTSMGFTPAGGLVMGTRSGDIDPGLPAFLARRESLSVKQIDHLLNRESGLLGLSGISADMRTLCEREKTSSKARDAVSVFCLQAKKYLGAYAAVLNGLDTLVFSGGIGENAVDIRRRICADLDYLGVEVDDELNQKHASVISSKDSCVTVRVMKTNEELVIAREVLNLMRRRKREKAGA